MRTQDSNPHPLPLASSVICLASADHLGAHVSNLTLAEGINYWYGSPYVTTLVLDTPMPAGAENPAPVDMRGWCIFERALSSITKLGHCCLELSRLPPPGATAYEYWVDLTTPLQGARSAPLSPDAFERKLTEGMAREKEAPGTGFRFTNGCVWAHLFPLLRTACAHSSARGRRSRAPLVFSCGHSKDATSVCIPQYKQGFERLWCGADL